MLTGHTEGEGCRKYVLRYYLNNGHIMTSVKLTFDLLGVKCCHFISSYYPTICVKLPGKWHMELRMTFDPMPPKSNHFITWFQETVSKKINFVFMMWLPPAANTRSVKTTTLFSWLTQLLFSQSTHCLENVILADREKWWLNSEFSQIFWCFCLIVVKLYPDSIL